MALHLKGAASGAQKLTLTTSAAGTVRYFAFYTDAPNPITPSSNITPDSAAVPAVVSAATTVDLLAGAGASTTRNVKGFHIFNEDASVTQNITVSVTDSTLTTKAFFATLLAGEYCIFDETGGFTVYDSAGKAKLSPGTGTLLARTFLTAASGNLTTTANTRTIAIKGVGGGAAGAGCTSVAAAASAGGGGGGGGWLEKFGIAVNPSTAYAYVCGAAGAGASGAAGGNGGISTLIVGGTTYTAQAGLGAPVATAVTTLIAYRGGLMSTVSTNGDINSAGQPGHMGLIYIAAGAGVSGPGGSSPWGAGGSAVTAAGNGTAALGFGAGGSGALTGASAVRTGGNGTPGAWLAEEFS